MLDKAAVSLLLEHGASPLDSNAEGMTPQDIVYQSSEGQDAEAAKVIAAILCASCDQMQDEMARDARRARREAQWRMSEPGALLHCVRHGSVPMHVRDEEGENKTDKRKTQKKLSGAHTSYMIGRAVFAELAEENDFAELLDAAFLSNGGGDGEDGSSNSARLQDKSLLEIAVRNFHIEMVEILLPHASASDRRRAAVIAEEVISGLVVDGELECLSRRRGQRSFGDKHRERSKGNRGRRRKRGDDDDNEFDDGEGHSRRVAGPNLGCMTSILRLLSPNHMLFVEERLRKRERVREGVKELQGVSENQISCGIDALLLDPKEEQQVMERVAKRANARRLKRQRRARRLVEKNKREAEQVREREKARRLKNAAMLLDGKAFDVKKKKFWFETGWTAERFMEPLNGMENEAEEEGAYYQANKTMCCCVVS